MKIKHLLAFLLLGAVCVFALSCAKDGGAVTTSGEDTASPETTPDATPDTSSPDTTEPVVTEPETTAPPLFENDNRHELYDLIKPNGRYGVTVEQTISVPGLGDYFVAQGACTDGTYGYVAMRTLNNDDGVIARVDLASGKVVAYSEPLPINHANDMTYNPETRQIIVVHNAPNRQLISFVDVDTLTLVSTANIGYNIFCMAYDEIGRRYVVGLSGGTDFRILDENLQPVADCTGKPGTVTQGVYCDQKYIYFPMSDPNRLVVYDWDGNYIVTMMLTFGKESESAFWCDGSLWICDFPGKATGGGVLYRITFTPRN